MALSTYSDKDMERFHANYIPEPMSGCFLWIGTVHGQGYGTFRIGSKKDGSRRNVLAHRMACELAYGEIPSGMMALHRCDNKACVNPSHLYIGTHADNTRDAVARHRFTGGSLPGEKNPKAKLTEQDVLFVRKSDLRAVELAEMFDVTNVTIYDIKNGKTWGHLNGA